MPDSTPPQSERLDSILARHRSEGRRRLLPVLIEAQHIYGHLPPEILGRIGQELKVPLADIHGVVNFYSMLYDRPTGRTIVRVCMGPCCVAKGSQEALDAVCRHYGVLPGEVSQDDALLVEEAPCLGLCDHAPAALVNEQVRGEIKAEEPSAWIEGPGQPAHDVIDGDVRSLTARCGEIEPTDLKAFKARNGFSGLRRALKEMTPAQVVAEIKASGLIGRGGAAFPTGMKWEFAAGAKAARRIVVCNGDESEPGTFKDRILMSGDPLAVLEGMLIAGYAIGATQGYLYVRGEYPGVQGILQAAIDAARKAGYLGKNILRSSFSFDVELRSGAGAYVCGEETALFESIEGKRGHPRLKPPYPTSAGLFGEPTVINNVETLCAAAWIMANGAAAYRALGTEASPGAKLFCLSGDVARPGVYEVPFGTQMRKLLQMAGGVQGDLQAILLGGAAGAFAGAEQLDLAMSFEGLREAGLPLGSGVLMVFNQERDMRRILLSIAQFFAHESCGKCLPCQIGTQRQLEIVRKLMEGKLSQTDWKGLQDINQAMRSASLCGLGMTAGTAIASAIERWPGLFLNER
jgi:NADH-quinone oxidoreductase subunit F